MSLRSLGKGPRRVKILSGCLLGLALSALPTHAEDPLLGEIKVIKCVGCIAGKVTLVVHDPIDIVDFEVTILDADYEKIITPLPGKRVYDRGDGCFYWNQAPKVVKKDTSKTAMNPLAKDANKNGRMANKGLKDKAVDSTSTLASDTNPSAAEEDPTPAIIPSKCLPYERVPLPKLGKGD